MSDPTLHDLVSQLHIAVHGSTWARPESPAVVWAELLAIVQDRHTEILALLCDWRQEALTAIFHAGSDDDQAHFHAEFAARCRRLGIDPSEVPGETIRWEGDPAW